MLKIFAFICFVLIGTVCGMKLSDRLKGMRDSCREIHAVLNKIASLISYRALDVYEIVSELKKDKFAHRLHFLEKLPDTYEPGTDFHEIWNNAVAQDKEMAEEERNILTSFGDTLGTSDIEGQLAAIESAIREIQMIEKMRNDDYYRKGKLYRSIGTLIGLMTGIMVL